MLRIGFLVIVAVVMYVLVYRWTMAELAIFVKLGGLKIIIFNDL